MTLTKRLEMLFLSVGMRGAPSLLGSSSLVLPLFVKSHCVMNCKTTTRLLDVVCCPFQSSQGGITRGKREKRIRRGKDVDLSDRRSQIASQANDDLMQTNFWVRRA